MDSTPLSPSSPPSPRSAAWMCAREKRCQWYPGEGGREGWRRRVFCEWSRSGPDSCVYLWRSRSSCSRRAVVAHVLPAPPQEPLTDLLLLHVSPAIRLSSVTPRFSSPWQPQTLASFPARCFFHTHPQTSNPTESCLWRPKFKDPIFVLSWLYSGRQSTCWSNITPVKV